MSGGVGIGTKGCLGNGLYTAYKAKFDELYATKAVIKELEAEKAAIKKLKAEIADVKDMNVMNKLSYKGVSASWSAVVSNVTYISTFKKLIINYRYAITSLPAGEKSISFA